MDVKEIQKRQEEYDAKYWEHSASELEKIRHITLHMGKLLGKLSSYCEHQEHGKDHPTTQIRDEVIADLLVYASQLANLLDVKDMGKAYLKRQEDNIKRLHSNK